MNDEGGTKGRFGTLIPRPGGILPRDLSPDLFPYEAFTFDPESTASPVLTLNSPWSLKATPYAPVAGEPSLGTGHITSDANRSAATLVSTSVNTAGVWSAAVTIPNVPPGAKAAYCWMDVLKAASIPALCVEAATGYTLSDITVGTNFAKYFGVYSPSSGIAARGVVKIHLDANGQFRWCTDTSSSTVHIYSPIDYDM